MSTKTITFTEDATTKTYNVELNSVSFNQNVVNQNFIGQDSSLLNF